MLRNYAKVYFLALPILIVLQLSWNGVIAQSLYVTQLGAMLAPTPNYYAVVLFFVSYAFGITYFAIVPALRDNSFFNAFLQAGIFGAVTDLSFNLMNSAILPTWPLMITIVDVMWGTIAAAVTSGLTYILAQKLYDVTFRSGTSTTSV